METITKYINNNKDNKSKLLKALNAIKGKQHLEIY